MMVAARMDQNFRGYESKSGLADLWYPRIK